MKEAIDKMGFTLCYKIFGMIKNGILYLCDSCGTEKGVKERKYKNQIKGNFCLSCWNTYKKDIGKVFICSECGSNKASRRYISTGVGKNNYYGITSNNI